jgi:two-component system chemotaxis response regulator CheY
MIVDDSPAMRTFIRRAIVMSGIEVGSWLQAANGREALDCLRQNTVDIVLSDINMPEMDGEQLLRNLHADKDLNRIPVLILSTDATERRMNRMIELGAQGYVTKPFLPEVLRGELERVLGAPNA